jgi:hypothetical protein
MKPQSLCSMSGQRCQSLYRPSFFALGNARERLYVSVGTKVSLGGFETSGWYGRGQVWEREGEMQGMGGRRRVGPVNPDLQLWASVFCGESRRLWAHNLLREATLTNCGS